MANIGTEGRRAVDALKSTGGMSRRSSGGPATLGVPSAGLGDHVECLVLATA